jgi:energy-coupling factor transporter ATP-binding protein EcfA2
MKVVYLGRESRRTNHPPSPEGDVLELLSNNWDDYGYRTTFITVCRINGASLELGNIRILLDDASDSSSFLDKKLAKGWNGRFPVPDCNFLSVPSEISFYEQLVATLGTAGAIDVASALRDTSYLVRVLDDEDAKRLLPTDGFQNSLQRERGSIKSYIDGWKILARESIAVLDMGFQFHDVLGHPATLNLKFQSESILPHDINVLIGPNGSGKSRVLHQIVNDWISDSPRPGVGFISKPNLSQVVVVSYSPFEQFRVDLAREKLQDKEAYRYFGFRGRSPQSDDGKIGKIRLSHEFPKRNGARSLIAALVDDQRYKTIADWAQKLRTIEKVLSSGFDFDFAAVEVSPTARAKSFVSDQSGENARSPALDFNRDGDTARFIPITSDRIDQLDAAALTRHVVAETGVAFFKDGNPIELSSGQRLFAYIVINIVGAIRRNSLILIDEPELFLHPTLEIQFIDMLKKVLAQFNSKALLATHSVVTVREMPADCVHVFERADDEVHISNPPFQTFGGDVQRISSYVFSDKSANKPFERWISDQVVELGSSEAVISRLEGELNEELIVQLRAIQRDQW